MYKLQFLAIVSLWLGFFSPTLEATYSFSPIVGELAPSGPKSTHLFHITNPTAEPIALQCYAAERSMDIDGKETLNEEVAEELFLIYPSQVILPPNKQQVVRVTWLGDNDISKELTYRLFCKQLPIDLRKAEERKAEENQGESNIRLLYHYAAALYIVPKGAKPYVTLETAQPFVDEEDVTWLELVFSNTGTKHQLLKDIELTVISKEDPSKTTKVTKGDFPGSLNILSGNKKRFLLPWPETLPQSPVKVRYDFHGKTQETAQVTP